jgi:hypothetical protein
MTARLRSTLATSGLALMLLGLAASSASAYQGAGAAPPRQKEPTDGFFDSPPPDPNAEPKEYYGVPAYMITSALGAGAIFMVCKSARRS